MKRMAYLSAALLFSACMEPQPAPSLTQIESSAFAVTEFATGLNKPWSVAPLPDGGAIVTEAPGTMKRVSTDGSVAGIEGVPAIYYPDNPNTQSGLFDVVLSRDFATTGRVFISYAYGTAEANGTALVSARLDGTVLEEVTEIYRADAKDTDAHYGAKIVALPDGTVALSTGDGFAYREQAQALDSSLGKVIRIHSDGSIPADNPFRDGARPEVWSYGHRNVQGLAYDEPTQTLWEHEHGPRGGDELNRIEASGNYGWPIATTGSDYNGMRISPFEEVDGFKPFTHDWVPSIAPSGLAIYRGELFPEWNGDALVGALAGQSLHRLDLENGQVVGEEVLLGDLKARIRDVRVGPEGDVWVLTNEESGRLLKIAPKAN